MEPLEIRYAPGASLRRLVGVGVALTAFAALVAGGCLLALLTQPLDGPQALSAAVVGGTAILGTTYGVRGVRAGRALARPVVVGRLDHDGVHLHEGVGVPGLPADAAWTTLPWPWISSVSHTSFDLAVVRAMGGDTPLDCLRFVLADDDLLDGARFDGSATGTLAEWLGLTPRQTRTVLLAEAGAPEHREVLAWLAQHRPGLPVVTGTTAPWTTKGSSDRHPGTARVAVVGAHGRLGRLVVAALARREEAPPVAVVRNEAHRATLERLGAEVRMLDVEEQEAPAVASALRGCAAVVHVATAPPERVVEGARRAGVQRLLTVPGVWNGEEQVAVAARSGLQWTAFRPAQLTAQAPTGEVELGLEVTPGQVPRADLAEVIAAAIRDEDSVGAAWAIAGVASPADS